jgi:hypothetical protein
VHASVGESEDQADTHQAAPSQVLAMESVLCGLVYGGPDLNMVEVHPATAMAEAGLGFYCPFDRTCWVREFVATERRGYHLKVAASRSFEQEPVVLVAVEEPEELRQPIEDPGVPRCRFDRPVGVRLAAWERCADWTQLDGHCEEAAAAP